MDEIRLMVVSIVSGVLAFLNPIQDFMISVVIVFIVNFFCGLLDDVVHGEGWKTKKALAFIAHCFIFFGLATFLFTCGHFMHNDTGAVQCVSYICYVAFYIYLINILRNLKSIVKNDDDMYKVLDFCYYVISLKFAEKIPYLKDWKNVNNVPEEEK